MRKLFVLFALGGLYWWWRSLQEVTPSSLVNKVVVITGASAGIGRATAHQFARYKARIVLVARREEALNEVKNELARYGAEVLIIPADVSLEKDIKRVVSQTEAKFGQIDVLVNNAGLSMGGYFETADSTHIRKMLDLNVKGLIRMTQVVLPAMLERKSGYIVNVSSVAGILNAPGETAYAASKSAVNTFSDALRRELHGKGVHVAKVLPGWTKTDMTAKLDTTLSFDQYSIVNPLMPMQDVELVAKAIVDAVRFRKSTIVLGGVLPQMNAILPRLLEWMQDVFYFKLIDKEHFVESLEELGT